MLTIERVDLDRVTQLAELVEACRLPWSAPAIRSSLLSCTSVGLILLSSPTVGLIHASPAPVAFVLGAVVACEASLFLIGVHPTRQGQGLGRRMLQAFENEVYLRGATEIHLEVSARNRVAVRLYESHGYSEIGRRRAYYADGSDALLLMRQREEPRSEVDL